MQLEGLKKLASRSPYVSSVAASTTLETTSGFYIMDGNSDHHFLVDTGAFKSIVPATARDKNHPQDENFRLVAANGTRIMSFGTRPFTVKLGGRLFRWTFVLADVETLLLGADFLAHYGLLVDVRNKRLLDLESFASFPLKAGPKVPPVYMV